MASMVREQVSNKVKLGGHFALMLEQIFVVLRYLNNGNIHEDFLDFIPADGLDAHSLLKSVKHTSAKCDIDKNAYIARCYDRANLPVEKPISVEKPRYQGRYQKHTGS